MAPESVPSRDPTLLSPEERRWLHDKYERLAGEEDKLSSTRTSYFAAIGTVIMTGLVVAIADLWSQPFTLAVSVTFYALFGVLISVVWDLLLRRTSHAASLWRGAAFQLEEIAPPLGRKLETELRLQTGEMMRADLSVPYHVHDELFSESNHIPRIDRINPTRLTEILPITFACTWSLILALAWVWYFFRI